MKSRQKLSITFGLLLTVCTAQPVTAATYSLTPNQNIQSTVGNLSPGDTLTIQDGTYNQTLSVTSSGTSSQPITIKAANDGKAIFDGQNSRPPVIISGSYIHLEGITAANSNDHVINIRGNYVTAKRTTAYNAMPTANRHVWMITGSYVTLEDCVGAGTGRYMFLNYSGVPTSRGFVCRRCFARWYDRNDPTSTGASPRFGFGVYGATEAIFENVIATHALPVRSTDEQTVHGGILTTWTNGEPGHVSPTNIKVKGSIFYNNFNYGAWLINGGSHLAFDNVVFIDNKNSSAAIGSPAGLACASPTNCSVTHSTFVNNYYGVRAWNGSENTLKMENNLFIRNHYVAGQNTAHQNHNYWQNQAMGSLQMGTNDTQIDPKLAVSAYGQGGYLFIPNNSPMKNAGVTGTDVGANILYRYQNGQLTTEPLWPWPMEERIRLESSKYLGQTISATWEQNEGLWKTLDGVYQSAPTSPSPKPGDLNGDGRVNIFDFNLLVSNFGNPYTMFDYNLIMTHFGS